MRWLVAVRRALILLTVGLYMARDRQRQGGNSGDRRRVTSDPGRQQAGRRALSVVGNLLVGVGIVTFVVVGALYAYGAYERYRFEQELPALLAGATGPEESPPPSATLAPVLSPTPSATLAPTLSPTPSATEVPAGVRAEATASATPTEVATVGPSATSTPTPTATATSTPTPRPRPPQRIAIPKIAVDALVVLAQIENGEWKVPKFMAGYLEGTAMPGQGSNVVLSGHVESISSGNVFARLGELRPGDAIALFIGERELNYVVAEVKVVKNDDLSVVAPAPEETLTLVTCTGTWLPLARDYDRRLIIVARPPQTPEPTGTRVP